MAAQWPTPTVADVEGGRKTRSGARSDEMLLNGLMRARWPSPKVAADRKGWETMDRQDSRSGMDIGQVMEAACGLIPREIFKLRPEMQKRLGFNLADRSGPTPNGSIAQTEKRGAPNPVFACWLMGWPDELTFGALRAIQLFRGSRRKSSRRSSKAEP
jgi:hypothetical protein